MTPKNRTPQLLAAIALALGLAACETFPEPAAPAAQPKPQAQAKPVKKAAKPAEKKQAEPKEAKEAPAAATAAVVPAEPKPAPLVAADVVGKREDEVLALLGRPVSETAMAPARVLRFVAEGCAVDVHLFPDVKQGGYRALELVAGGGELPAEQCLGRMRRS